MADTPVQFRPVISLLIPVYDKTSEQPLPPKWLWYQLAYDRASPDEIAAVLRIIGSEDAPKRPGLTPRAGQWAYTYSLSTSSAKASRQLLAYRHLFEPVGERDPDGSDWSAGGVSLTCPPDYLEDQDGHPMTLLEVMDCEAQRKGSRGDLLLDCPESVLRHGPVQPIQPELWTQANADLVAEFFKTCRFLATSRWLRSPCEVSIQNGVVQHSQLPLSEDCMSVLLPFRKLYSSDSSDNLFNKACNLHNRHCPPDTAHFTWVKYYKGRFNAQLESPPGFVCAKANMSTRRYLDAFLYGAGAVHVTGRDSSSKADYEHLLATRPQAQMIVGFHANLHLLLSYVSLARCVMEQNVRHWTRDLGWYGPSSVSTQDPFGGTV